ncbi:MULTISPECIES: stalk domain-containing protein [Paenibacillus]|uniref:stalk domain-containing protein n=1 Tax=Paenibacillus TaxID=44249 RepID=UPI0003FBE161|nr:MULTISPECIES: stalk domain-containing protein [Paenibacillus]KEO79992.1 copper amine oxidase [Paenibacillus polymyxa]MCH6186092.1 copper amine oxidase N-terminal domain-containing protein [Paenibacillus polymyxa]UMY55884.1 copper amine oxidase N-terminal domain-containing protein [Paenibacillus peoriae]WRL60898.1 stalk domain-containing protein [Paenibacillus polymyxa]
MSMKKWMLSLTAVTLLWGATSTIPTTEAASSTKPIEVLLNAKKIQFPDAKPFQDSNDYVMVPIRFVSEALGAKVGWEKTGGQLAVSIKNDAHAVNMTVGQNTATVDGQTKTYETKIILKQNRTFVPLRLVSEGLGQTVEWDKVSRWVWIGKKEIAALEDTGHKTVSIEPYKKAISTIPNLMKNVVDGTTYEKVVIFKQSDLPTKLLREIYSVEPYTTPKGVPYLRMRVKTSSSTAASIFYLTKNKDARLRPPLDELTQDNGDGTKMIYYPIYSSADGLFQGIKNYKSFKLTDIQYIGFRLQGDGYIPMMVNPWKNN